MSLKKIFSRCLINYHFKCLINYYLFLVQPSIEHLITLSANVNSPTENKSNFGSYSEDFGEDERSVSVDNSVDNLGSSPDDDPFEVDTDFTYLNINDEELQKQKEEFKKFELLRKGSQETNVINESPLETIEDEEVKTREDTTEELIKGKLPDESIYHNRTSFSEIASDNSYPLFPKGQKDSDLLTCNQNQLPTFNPQGSSQEAFKHLRQRKTETESLCGLKVQYRFGAPETSSDDDADVVIEEETSDYNIPSPHNTQSNVCQFLSHLTQSPPKTTKPRIGMISSPSLLTPPVNNPKFKTAHKFALNRIKSTIQKGFKIMVILRGLPGSGKSYLATDIIQSTVGGDPSQYIFCTDDFFLKKGKRIYEFNPSKLPDAHAFNQKQVLKVLTDSRSPVIIDNTNTQCWEMQPYVKMAVQYGYYIEILEPDTPWAYNVVELTKRNKHNVPRESIQRMLQRFERNITAANLLRMFSLRYDPYNMPPQPCLPPSSPSKPKHASLDLEKAKKYNKKNKIVLEVEKNIEDRVPLKISNARVVNALPNPYNENLTALQLALKTFGGEDEDLSSKENAQTLIEDKWQDDGISWEDMMLNLEIKNKNSEAFRETLNEESSSMDNKMNVVNENKASLNLGAIGSERKNSMIRNKVTEDSSDDDNENILAQCWDFTLLLDGRQIHSVEALIENGKDEEERHEDTPEKSDDSEKSKSPSDELKEAENTRDKDSPDSVTKSYNTESFEHIDSNGEDLALDTKDTVEISTDCLENSELLDHGNFSTDSQAKVSFGSIMTFIKKSFLGANNEESKVKKLEDVANGLEAPKSSETVRDTLTEKLQSPIEEQSNIKTLNYGVDNLSDSNDTLSKKLSNTVCKFSVSNLICEAQGNFESVESLGSEIKNNSNDSDNVDLYSSMREISSDNESFLSVLEASNILSPDEINLNGLNSADRLLSSLPEASDDKTENWIKSETIKLTGPLARAVLSLEENEKLILEEKELRKSETKNSEINLDTSSKYFETIDNINSITWKESPYPTCEISVPVKVEKLKNVVMSEASTNTSIYDFNVLYVGGTSEPEYTLLKTVNRSINEGLILSNLETPPPRKLKLDKSSMTNDVDILLKLPNTPEEIEETEKEMIQGLFDMFPHIPKDYVIDVYKNLCKGDSHWAIDVLLEGVPPGGILNTQPLKSPIAEDSSLNSSPFRNKRGEKFKQSLSSDSNESEPSSPSKRKEKNQISEASLALKKYLEEKVMINEASYHPHVLRVKKWKNREPDVPTEEIIEAQSRSKDVIQFINDLNPTSPPEVATSLSPTNSDQSSNKEKEESDGDDSSEPEETIELNLGWDFIKNLEKEFGNPNFQLPDGLFPVIQVKKSVAEELHALWMESMQQQMDTQQEHLDAMIAKGKHFMRY